MELALHPQAVGAIFAGAIAMAGRGYEANEYFSGLYLVGTLLIFSLALFCKSTLDLMKTKAFGGRVMKVLEVREDRVGASAAFYPDSSIGKKICTFRCKHSRREVSPRTRQNSQFDV